MVSGYARSVSRWSELTQDVATRRAVRTPAAVRTARLWREQRHCRDGCGRGRPGGFVGDRADRAVALAHDAERVHGQLDGDAVSRVDPPPRVDARDEALSRDTQQALEEFAEERDLLDGAGERVRQLARLR